MNTQHTPGPWTIEDPLGDDILCIMQADKPINVATWVAQIGLGKDSECDPGYDEAHANARLITAAPDLLEALTNLLWEAETAGRCGKRVDAAKAAIAKATLAQAT